MTHFTNEHEFPRGAEDISAGASAFKACELGVILFLQGMTGAAIAAMVLTDAILDRPSPYRDVRHPDPVSIVLRDGLNAGLKVEKVELNPYCGIMIMRLRAQPLPMCSAWQLSSRC